MPLDDGSAATPGEIRTIGELSRNLSGLAGELRRVIDKVEKMPEAYVTRAENELQMGGVKIDIRRLERGQEEMDRELESTKESFAKKLSDIERDRRSGNRWAIGLAATAIGLVLTGTGVLFAVLPVLLRGTGG